MNSEKLKKHWGLQLLKPLLIIGFISRSAPELICEPETRKSHQRSLGCMCSLIHGNKNCKRPSPCFVHLSLCILLSLFCIIFNVCCWNQDNCAFILNILYYCFWCCASSFTCGAEAWRRDKTKDAASWLSFFQSSQVWRGRILIIAFIGLDLCVLTFDIKDLLNEDISCIYYFSVQVWNWDSLIR